MTKNRNKGFSLIDVIIAVAVLSILVTPILMQVIQTIRTSAAAKERQTAVDNAQYIMEYFQAESFENPISESIVMQGDGKANIVSSTELEEEKVVLFKLSGTDVDFAIEEAGLPNEEKSTLTYKIKDYRLSNSQFGRNKNEYSRIVEVDDMDINIRSKKYQIKRDFTDSEKNAILGQTVSLGFDVDDLDDDFSGKWELMSDGSIVVIKNIDATGTEGSATFDHIVAVLVEESPYDSYINPNDISVGNARNIKDAAEGGHDVIIPGTTSDYDKTAYKTFFGDQMLKYQEEDFNGWQESVLQEYGDFETATINKNNQKFPYRFITVSVTKPFPDKYENVYNVRCEVNYYFDYMVTGDITGEDTLSYTIYDQTFEADSNPNIYLYYEPFICQVVNNDVSESYYAPADYIGVYNDYLCKDSRLYLIKPDKSQLRMVEWLSGAYSTESAEYKAREVYFTSGPDKCAYYSDFNEIDQLLPVQIYVVDLDTSGTEPKSYVQNEDGELEPSDTIEGNEVPPLKVISNMTVDLEEGEENKFEPIERFKYGMADGTMTDSTSCGGVFFTLPAVGDTNSLNDLTSDLS
ncbi:MAG: hypothetical protein IJ167_07450, partial [Lachnospiraceae bacterium]|nr:hypothetical protein [Lachnospiraceae bacterium]